MKPQPKVSVLVPAYNEEKYIEATLRALAQQTYPHVEVLVVNNASTDCTAAVAKAFIQRNGLSPRFRLLHESRKGTQHARECGRRAASGEVLAQLDADCLPPPAWIRRGVALLQKEGVVAVAGPYCYFDSAPLVRLITAFSQRVVFPLLNRVSQGFRKGGIIIGGNVFVKAEALEKAGGYNTALTFYGDDADLAKSLSRQGRIVFTNAVCVKSSSRRYACSGFWKVQAKYTQAFFQTLLGSGISDAQSAEVLHPR